MSRNGHMNCAVAPSRVSQPVFFRLAIDINALLAGPRGARLQGVRPRGGPDPKLASGQGGSMKSLWQAFWSDESGQGLVEYALIIALVAVGLIAILLVLRNSIGDVFNNASEALQNAPANPYP